MHPILFHIGDVAIHTYGACLALAILVGVSWAMNLGKKRGLDPYMMSEVGLWTVLIGLLGARLAYVVQDIDYYIQEPLELFNIRRGGIAIQGALLFGFSATAYTCYKRKINILNGLDVYMAPVLLGMAIGRIGCIMQGCCYGKPCSADLPWAITYPATSHIAMVSRHPSQIYEALMDVVLMLLVLWLYRKASFYGQAFWMGIAGCGVVRFISDLFRDNGSYLANSVANWAQVASVLFFIIGMLGVLGKFGRKPIEIVSSAENDG